MAWILYATVVRGPRRRVGKLVSCNTILNTFFFFQAEDGIRDLTVTGVQTCALPISTRILQREVNLQSTGENCDGRIGAGLGDAGIISASIPARLPSSIESCKRGQQDRKSVV